MILERKTRKPKKIVKTLTGRNRAEPTRTKYPKGRIIRVSAKIYDMLRKKLRRGESWDQLVRRLHNVPQRDGSREDLYECWLLKSTGVTFTTKALARGAAVKAGVLKGHLGKFEEPIKVREVI